MRRRRAASGFTFIEMIVALAVFALVMTGLYGTFQMAQQAMSAGNARAETSQIARVVLDEITRDLSNVYPLHINPEDVDPDLAAQLGNGTIDLVFVGQSNPPQTPTDRQKDSLSFVTTRASDPTDTEIGSDLEEVTYVINDDPTTGQSGLVKIINRLPGLAVEPMQPDTEQLSDRIHSLKFRYFDPNSQEWQDDWLSGSTLPEAVEVTFEIDPTDPRGQPTLVTSTVRLINQSGTASVRSAQTPGGGTPGGGTAQPSGGQSGAPASGSTSGAGGGQTPTGTAGGGSQ